MPISARAALTPRQALLLGLAQGPTELLPVSSSAHTTLIPLLLDWPYDELDGEQRKSFEVALHAGASVALAIDMRRELLDAARRLDRRRVSVIVLSLAPAVLAGAALRSLIARRLGGPRAIAGGLLGGSAAMSLAELAFDPGERAHDDARASDGIALGLAQAVALAPGVSRYGATLAVARARGFAHRDAQMLSWHAALPVMLGASALEAALLVRRPPPAGASLPLAVGAAAALVSTSLSARLLRRPARALRSLLPSAAYRVLLAAFVFARLRGRRAQ
ncbi:MAG TPA: undecaprenyl-diphosphate phosphatase [Solirubrobacteraceae bacterium]|jgi:undecaprenyl-diphosphatase|nr:undecaprenyl-diphosphate phosphatase [Solirubrobacteraceae bacterium]